MGDQYVMRRMMHSSRDIKEDIVYDNSFVFHEADQIEKMYPAEVRFFITGQMLVMGFKNPEMRGPPRFCEVDTVSRRKHPLCSA